MERSQEIVEEFIQPEELAANELNIIYPNKIYLPTVHKAATVLFKDDFSNPASGWPVGDFGFAVYAYNAGEYQINVLLEGIIAWSTATHTVSDFDATVTGRQAGVVSASYGLVFGLTIDGSQFYTFSVDPEFQYWYLERWDNGSSTVLDYGGSLEINPYGSNEIRVKRQGTSLTLYANGKILRSKTLTTYSDTRRLGLVAGSWDVGGADVRFDNYLVTQP